MSIINGRRRLDPPDKERSKRADGKRLGRKPFYSVKEIKWALRLGYGNYAEAARLLTKKFGRGRGSGQAIYKQVLKHNLLEYVHDCHRASKDFAMSNLLRKAKTFNDPQCIDASKFIVRHSGKNKHTGHSEFNNQVEISGPGGGPIQTQDVPNLNLKSLSEEELLLLEKLMSKAGAKTDASQQDQPGPSTDDPIRKSKSDKKRNR